METEQWLDEAICRAFERRYAQQPRPAYGQKTRKHHLTKKALALTLTAAVVLSFTCGVLASPVIQSMTAATAVNRENGQVSVAQSGENELPPDASDNWLRKFWPASSPDGFANARLKNDSLMNSVRTYIYENGFDNH